MGGAFPVYNTDLNFSSNQPQKFASYDKFLFGGQLGFDWSPAKDWKVKFGAAYYYFYNIEGKLSDPYTPQNINDAGNTDNSRPSFARKGNTYMALRNIVPMQATIMAQSTSGNTTASRRSSRTSL